jgi:hypothetical protein
MASFYECMAAVVTALGRRITVDEFDALYTRLDDERARLFAGGFPSDWLAAARTVAQQIEIEKAIAQRQVIRNKLVYQDGKAFIAAARRTVDAGRALEARLVGINTPIEGGRKSIAAETHGLWTTALGAMLADLRRAGNGERLVKLFSDRGFELEIAKALRGEKAHADALTIAQAIDKAREDLRRQENDAGGWRGKLDGYVTRQSHDSLRVRRAGYEQWKARILPRLDGERTFGRQEELLMQLRQERGQVRLQLLTAGGDLTGAMQELRTADRLDEKATARGRRLDASERQMGGQVNEVRKAMADALQRYMELATKAREGGRAAAPLLGEKGQIEVGGRQLGEARVALTRARERLEELHRQASAGRGRSIETDLVRQHLAERVEQAAAIAARTEKGVDLLTELYDKLHDYERRIKGPVDPDAFLRRIYNAIAADTWMRGHSEEFKGLLSHIGPSNLARRRAAHRELHFKSAEDEVAYMREFGAGGLADSVIREIEGAAAAVSLMRQLGPNPEAMFQQLRTDLLKEAHDTGDNALARAVQRKRLDWQLAEVLGATRQVANPSIASWAASIRVLQSMAKLGGAMLSSFGDVATSAAELRYQGRGALQSYGDMLEGLFKGRRGGERRIIGDLLGVGFESLSGHVLARMGGEAAPPGGLARASALFFRLNGLSWWTDTHKTTAGLVIARYFAAMADRIFGKLPEPTRRLLGQYGIDAARWEVLRRAGANAAEDGTRFLTPEGVKAIPLGHFLELATDIDPSVVPSERAMREVRDRLASAYAALVTDRVEFAVPTPGARERAIINAGTQRGDLLGEALRFIMQFKSFNISMVSKTFGRDLYGGAPGGKLSATTRLAWLAFQLTIFGYLSMSAKELLQGKNVRDPKDPGTWAAAMAQGGGLGIMGDFAFGEFNRFGRSALATAAGPTFGTTDDLFELWAKARDTDKMGRGRDAYGKDMAATALRIATSNTPGASLFWARPAINYLALYPIQESLNPGYLRRMERRIERENKQTFWLSPSETVR